MEIVTGAARPRYCECVRRSGPEVAAGWQGRSRTPFGGLLAARSLSLGPLSAATAIAGSVAVGALFRIPFLTVGLGPDEGGYAYVAGQWARGARLYGADWVDRPQGLLIAYRLLLDEGHSAWAIRLGALLFGCGIVLLLGVAGWLLAGPWTGAAAAIVYAVLGVAPHLQGFTFNGELASALPSTAAVVAVLAWRRDGRARWLLIAGSAGAAGLLMKQSGFDGLIVVLAVVFGAGRGRQRRAADVAAVTIGAAVPFGLSALHGLLVGWSNYWFAVAGYKLEAPSGASLDVVKRFGALGTSWLGAQRDLAVPVAVAIAVTAVAVLRRREIWIPAVWLLAAFLGMNTASLYWPHYYVQLLAPLALLLSVGAASLPGRFLAVAVVALVTVPAALKLIALDGMSRGAKERVIPYYGQFVRDERVAAEVDRHTRSGEPIYALDSEADLYFLAERPAAFKYLWAHPLEEVPGALEQLRALLAGKGRPELVVVFRSPQLVDRSGSLSRILAKGYRPLETVSGTGIHILRRHDPAPLGDLGSPIGRRRLIRPLD
jgi:hypothetical protein